MELPNQSSEGRTAEEWVNATLAGLQAPGGWNPASGAAWERMERARSRRRNWTFAATTVGAASLALLAFPSTRAIGARCWNVCVAETSRVSGMLGLRGNSGMASGEAPDFRLRDANSRPIQLSSLRGKVVLLNFWATWCPPCREEIPWFMEFQKTYRDRGLVVVGVSFDEDGWDAVKPFLARHAVNYPVAIGDGELAKRYGGVESIPSTFLIDREGRIVYSHAGILNREDLERNLEAALDAQ